MTNILNRNNVSKKGKNNKVMVFAHGFGCDQAMWDRLTPYFEDDYQLVLFDYVGSGESQLAAFNIERYSSIEGYAQDIVEVCDALEISGAIFVGHSVSCSAGIIAANKRPELFSQLILIGPSPCFLNFPPDYAGGFDKSDLEELLTLLDQNYVGWANYLAPVVAGLSGQGEIAGELADSFCSTDPIVAKTFAQTTFFSDNREDFRKNTIPCLLLQHKIDILAPLGVGEFLKSITPNSTYRIIDVDGHCAHMSHPDMVSEHIKQYLAETAQ